MLKKSLHKNTIGYALLTGAATATLLLVGHLSQPGQITMEWQLLKTPESAVELYFTHHETLPKKYTPGSISTIPFTVVSNDTAGRSYRYEITQEEDATTGIVKVLDSGEVQLENNRAVTKEIPVTYSDSGARSKITIRLPEQQQAIHYWVERQ